MPYPSGFKKTVITTKNPLVSTIIPAYNEERDIEEAIISIKRQTYPYIEIIVVDDGSTDETLAILKRHPDVRVLHQQHQGPGAAKNLGAQNARGEILVFIDADMILLPTYIDKMIRPVRENEILGTSEAIQYNIQKTKMQQCWGKIIGTKKKDGIGTASAVKAIARNDFLQLGGFDRKYGYADDRTFYLKYGLRFEILDGPRCWHKTPETAKGVYKQSKWIGASLDHPLFQNRILTYILIILGYVGFFIAIPALAIRKSYTNNCFNLLFPWMVIFIGARYFGTLAGLWKQKFWGINTRD